MHRFKLAIPVKCQDVLHTLKFKIEIRHLHKVHIDCKRAQLSEKYTLYIPKTTTFAALQ